MADSSFGPAADVPPEGSIIWLPPGEAPMDLIVVEPEPTPVGLYADARGVGKTRALIESMLALANERGIQVQVIYPTRPAEDALLEIQDLAQRIADAAPGYGIIPAHMILEIVNRYWERGERDADQELHDDAGRQ